MQDSIPLSERHTVAWELLKEQEESEGLFLGDIWPAPSENGRVDPRAENAGVAGSGKARPGGEPKKTNEKQVEAGDNRPARAEAGGAVGKPGNSQLPKPAASDKAGKPGEHTGKPGEHTGKPGEHTGKPGEHTGKTPAKAAAAAENKSNSTSGDRRVDSGGKTDASKVQEKPAERVPVKGDATAKSGDGRPGTLAAEVKPKGKDVSATTRPASGDTAVPHKDVKKEVDERGAAASKKTDRVLTGMLVSPDQTRQAVIAGNKIYDGADKQPVGVLEKDGIIRLANGDTTTINSRYAGWSFAGKSHDKDGKDQQNREFVISSLTSNGYVFGHQGKDQPPKKLDVEMGAVVDPETGAQWGTITPPVDMGGRLFGGELTLFGKEGSAITAPLSRFENSVFSLRLLGETGIDGKPIAGICKGAQPNDRNGYINLTEADWQAALVRENATNKINELEESPPYKTYLEAQKRLTEGHYSEAEKERLSHSQKYVYLDGVARSIQNDVRPWKEQERRSESIEAQYARVLRNGIVTPEILAAVEQSTQQVREMALGSPLRAAREKLDHESDHPELERISGDARKIGGKVETTGEDYTISQGKLRNARGEEIATIDSINNTLIVNGQASVRDGRLVIDRSQPEPDKQIGQTISIVPMGLLTGAKWNLTYEDEAGEQKHTDWMSLGPEHNNQIVSLAFAKKASQDEVNYAEAVNKEARSEATEKILAETRTRQRQFDSRAVAIFTGDRNNPEDVAYLAGGAARHVREVAWQAPLTVSTQATDLANELARIAKIKSGQLRRGDDFYNVGQGGKLTVTVGDKEEVVGQLLPYNGMLLRGKREPLDLENHVLLELTSNGRTEHYIGGGPPRATVGRIRRAGGLMPLEELQNFSEQLASRTSAARVAYVANTSESTRGLGESEVLLGKREQTLREFGESAVKDEENLNAVASKLLSEGFKRDSNGKFVLDNDRLSTAVAVIQDTQGALQWGARRAEELSKNGQEFQAHVTSGAKTAAIAAISGGVINPAFTALANSARLSTGLLVTGEVAATSLVGGAVAIAVDNAPSANRGLIVAGGMADGAAMGLTAFSRVMGTGVSFEKAKLVAKLSQSGVQLSAEEARLASTLAVNLVRQGATPAELTAAKIFYNGVENWAQTVGFIGASKLKSGQNPFTGYDPEGIIIGTIAGMAGDGAANGASEFMRSAEGKSLVHRLSNSMVPRVIEEFTEQIARQDRATALAMQLDVKQVSQAVLEEKRDISAALTAAFEAAAPAGLASLTASAALNIKMKEPNAQGSQSGNQNEHATRTDATGSNATRSDPYGVSQSHARDENQPRQPKFVVHGAQNPQGPHKTDRPAAEPQYAGVDQPRQPHALSMGAKLYASQPGAEQSQASRFLAASGIAAQQSASPSTQANAGGGGRRNSGSDTPLRASTGEGSKPPHGGAPDRPNEPGAADIGLSARPEAAPEAVVTRGRRLNAPGRDLAAEAIEDCVLAAGPSDRRRDGIKAQQAFYKAAEELLDTMTTADGKQTLRQAGASVFLTAPQSAADHAKIDVVLKFGDEWYGLDATLLDKTKEKPGPSQRHLDQIVKMEADWMDKSGQYWHFNEKGKRELAKRLVEILDKKSPFNVHDMPPPLLSKDKNPETNLQSLNEFIATLYRTKNPQNVEYARELTNARPHLEDLRDKAAEEQRLEANAIRERAEAKKFFEENVDKALDRAIERLISVALNPTRVQRAPDEPVSLGKDRFGNPCLERGDVAWSMTPEQSEAARKRSKAAISRAMTTVREPGTLGTAAAESLGELSKLANQINANLNKMLLPEMARQLNLIAAAGASGSAGDSKPNIPGLPGAPAPSRPFAPPSRFVGRVHTQERGGSDVPTGGEKRAATGGNAGSEGASRSVEPMHVSAASTREPSGTRNGGDRAANSEDKPSVDAAVTPTATGGDSSGGQDVTPSKPRNPVLGKEAYDALASALRECSPHFDRSKLTPDGKTYDEMESVLRIAIHKTSSAEARQQLQTLYDNYVSSDGVGADRGTLDFLHAAARKAFDRPAGLQTQRYRATTPTGTDSGAARPAAAPTGTESEAARPAAAPAGTESEAARPSAVPSTAVAPSASDRAVPAGADRGSGGHSRTGEVRTEASDAEALAALRDFVSNLPANERERLGELGNSYNPAVRNFLRAAAAGLVEQGERQILAAERLRAMVNAYEPTNRNGVAEFNQAIAAAARAKDGGDAGADTPRPAASAARAGESADSGEERPAGHETHSDAGQLSREEAVALAAQKIVEDKTSGLQSLLGRMDREGYNRRVDELLSGIVKGLKPGPERDAIDRNRALYAARNPEVMKEVNAAIIKLATGKESADTRPNAPDAGRPTPVTAPTPPPQAAARQSGVVGTPSDAGRDMPAGNNPTQGDTNQKDIDAQSMDALADAVRHNKDKYGDLSKIGTGSKEQHFEVHQFLRIAAERNDAAGRYLRTIAQLYRLGRPEVVQAVNNQVVNACKP